MCHRLMPPEKFPKRAKTKAESSSCHGVFINWFLDWFYCKRFVSLCSLWKPNLFSHRYVMGMHKYCKRSARKERTGPAGKATVKSEAPNLRLVNLARSSLKKYGRYR